MRKLKRYYSTFFVGVIFLTITLLQLNVMENSLRYETPETSQHRSVEPGRTSYHRTSVGSSSVQSILTEPGTAKGSRKCIKADFNIEGASQEDPKLIDYIRHHLLDPPSPRPYNLSNPDKIHFSQEDQSQYADATYFHGMRDGFFIEAGAVNGEYLSNTLYFERELGWRGLLVEPFPVTYQSLLQKNRKAYSINTALASSTKASVVNLGILGGDGELSQIFPRANGTAKKNTNTNNFSFYSILSRFLPVDVRKAVKVKAVPLYSILLALNITVVDFFSLDIESYEVKVLHTIPWNKVKFRLMCIEINHIPEGLDYLKEFLLSRGYIFLGVREVDAWFGYPELLNER